ncbi:MAG: family 78 glycoside hydrolase catalytic domain [Clostridia bacterium]|nr:family 78 glycoside hydrolase catalytic domain [Clostridia bacterium]
MITERNEHKFSASFITAPDKYLSVLADKEFHYKTAYSDSLWIWPDANVRGHLTRAFSLDFEPTDAYLEFIYNNKFDIYINGHELLAQKYGNMYRIFSDHISSHLKVGANILAVRLYQTNDPLSFSSALKGGIMIRGAEKELRIITDADFHSWLVCNFYEENEPDGWYLTDSGRQRVGTCAKSIHPKYLRRSCVFKKRFVCKKEIKKATLYATAMGLYEPVMNGTHFTTARFIPGSKDKVREYQVFDVTENIRHGENELSFTLGNGWLNSQSWGWLFDKKPSLLFELVIECRDGKVNTVCSDESTEVFASPLTENDLQFGERYDARLEELSMDTNSHAYAVPCAIDAKLIQQIYPPIRITEIDKCESFGALGGGVYLYDFGTNGAGRAKINLKDTKRGEVIKIRYAEFIKSDGMPHLGPYQEVYFPGDNKAGGVAEYAARNLDVYICRGDKEESYLPRFTYTGFRYVYIEGYSGEYTADTVERCIMHTDLKEVGDIETDNRDIAQIWDVIKRTYRSNIFTGPIDCPTREKNFWNGDIQAFAHTACWYMDNYDFLSSWSHTGRKLQYGIYGWEDEEYILPLVLYKFYGRREVIETKYPIVKALIEKRIATIEEGEVFPSGKYSPYRDWKSTENVSPEFHSALYFTHMFASAAKMADILGKTEEKNAYLEKWKALRDEFNKRFYDRDSFDYGQDCQSGIVLPIALGVAPEEDIPNLVKTLHGYVVKSDYHMTTGFMASEHILSILCDFGFADDAIKLIMQKTYPSLLNMIATGATTTTENWEGVVEYDDNRAYDSMNHFALGVVGRWFFEYLGGIKILEPGFSRILLEPLPTKIIGRFRATHNSPRGLIKSEISYDASKDEFTYSYSIPEGVTAYVKLPDSEQIFVNERIGKFTFPAKR